MDLICAFMYQYLHILYLSLDPGFSFLFVSCNKFRGALSRHVCTEDPGARPVEFSTS